MHYPVRMKKKTNPFNQRVTKLKWWETNYQIQMKWSAVARGKLTGKNLYIHFHLNFNFKFFFICIIEWRYYFKNFVLFQKNCLKLRNFLIGKIPEKGTSIWHRGPDGVNPGIFNSFRYVTWQNSPKTNLPWCGRPTIAKICSDEGVKPDSWLVTEWRKWRTHLRKKILKCGGSTFLIVWRTYMWEGIL